MTFFRSARSHPAAALSAVASVFTTLALGQTGPTLPAAYTTGYFYDLGGRQTGIIRPNPGDVSSPAYLATRNTYDATTGNLTRVDSGALASWPAAGTAPGSWTFTAIYQYKVYTYDAMGRKLTEELFGQDNNAYQLTEYSYDAMGREQCVAIRMNPAVYGSLPASACTLGTTGSNGPDRITYTTYDATSRPLKIQRAYGTSIVEAYATYTYTANHLQQSITDANNNQTWLTYDGLDRLSQTNFPSKTTHGSYSTTDFEQYTYDANNNRRTLVTRDSETITYNYDRLNRLISKLWPSSWGVSVYYGYDLRNLQLCANYSSACTVSNPTISTASVASDGVTTNYDGFGHVSTQAVNLSGTAQTMSYQYDADGSRTQVKYPDGNYIQYKFDGLNRLSQALENGSASAILAAYSYDSAGRVQQVTRGGGVTTTALGYDAISRPNAYSHTLATSKDNVSYSFSYNAANQMLTQGISNSEYDPQQGTPQTYTSNGLNQYAAVGGAPYSWDPRGNLTSNGSTTYSYDLENHLTGATGTYNASLTYDPLGRLYQTTSGSTTSRFIFDGDRIAVEYNSSGTLLRRYAFGPGGDTPIVWYEGSTVGQSNRRYLHPDHEGSIVTVTDGTGATLAVNQYDPYGVNRSSNQGRFQFTGQAYVSEVGLYYYKARMYNASLGRFIQTDPIGYSNDLNLYAYVYNDPTDKTDPGGTADWDLREFFHTCFSDPYSVGCSTTGTPQDTGTPGHDTSSVLQMRQMVSDAKANGDVNVQGAFDQTQTKSTQGTIDSAKRPDATVTSTTLQGDKVIRNGEVVSPSQTVASQEAKLAALAEKAPRSVAVINYTSRIGEVGGAAGKALGPAGMVVGVVGAAAAIKDNPNMSGIEFMYRAAGLYDVGVQLGLIPRPPQEF